MSHIWTAELVFDPECQGLNVQPSPQSKWVSSLKISMDLGFSFCSWSSEPERPNIFIHDCSRVKKSQLMFSPSSSFFSPQVRGCQLMDPTRTNSVCFTAADLGLGLLKIIFKIHCRCQIHPYRLSGRGSTNTTKLHVHLASDYLKYLLIWWIQLQHFKTNACKCYSGFLKIQISFF